MGSRTRLNNNVLGMQSSRDWPTYKGKAHDCMVLLEWLADFVRKNPSVGNYGKTRDTMLLAHAEYHRIMRGAGQFFSVEERNRFYDAGLTFLRCYTLLSRNAHLHGNPRFQLKPKHHALFHGFLYAKTYGMNPRSHWLFKHEDCVGLATSIGRVLHPATLSRGFLDCWLLQLALKQESLKQVSLKRNRDVQS